MKHQVIYLLSVINLFDLSEECNSSVYLLINANVDIVDNYFPGGDTYVSLSPNYLFREDIKNNPAVWIGILFETFIILIFPIIYLKSQNSNICIFMQNCNISLFAACNFCLILQNVSALILDNNQRCFFSYYHA